MQDLLTLEQIFTSPVGPGKANDNASSTQRNSVASISLAIVDAQWVVSAFRLGANGNPDYDNGEIFVRAFGVEETRARWLYRRCLVEMGVAS